MKTNVAAILGSIFPSSTPMEISEFNLMFLQKSMIKQFILKVCMLSLHRWDGKLVMGKIFKRQLLHFRMACEIYYYIYVWKIIFRITKWYWNDFNRQSNKSRLSTDLVNCLLFLNSLVHMSKYLCSCSLCPPPKTSPLFGLCASCQYLDIRPRLLSHPSLPPRCAPLGKPEHL